MGFGRLFFCLSVSNALGRRILDEVNEMAVQERYG